MGPSSPRPSPTLSTSRHRGPPDVSHPTGNSIFTDPDPRMGEIPATCRLDADVQSRP